MTLPKTLFAATTLAMCGALMSVVIARSDEAMAADVANVAALKPYDETADAKRDIDNALVAAKKTGKSVLVVFGANWCGDCKVLDAELKREKVDQLVRDHCHVVKVDVGRMDKNLDIVNRYEPSLLKKGIPAVVLLDADGKVKRRTLEGELADARKMGADAIGAFFANLLGKAK
jgi:protein disulfide-isomerase